MKTLAKKMTRFCFLSQNDWEVFNQEITPIFYYENNWKRKIGCLFFIRKMTRKHSWFLRRWSQRTQLQLSLTIYGLRKIPISLSETWKFFFRSNMLTNMKKYQGNIKNNEGNMKKYVGNDGNKRKCERSMKKYGGIFEPPYPPYRSHWTWEKFWGRWDLEKFRLLPLWDLEEFQSPIVRLKEKLLNFVFFTDS